MMKWVQNEYGTLTWINPYCLYPHSRVRRAHTLQQLGLDALPNEPETTQKSSLKCKRKRKIKRKTMGISRRASTLHSYRPRKDAFSQSYSAVVHNHIYKLISMLMSIGALYIRDTTYAVLPKQGDVYALDVLLSIIFLWLFLELLLYSLTHSNYCFTFFFWLDLVGTASILMDIPWIMIGIGLNNHIFLIVKGGRMGRAARGAGSVRFIKLIKMIRMIKLFRIIQLFRKKKKHNSLIRSREEPQFGEEDAEIKPTKMGSLLADRVTQKVILGVLLSFLILPLFDVGTMDQGQKTFVGLEDLEYIYSNYHNTTNGDVSTSHAGDYTNSLDRFISWHSKILYLKVGAGGTDDFNRVEINAPNHSLRDEERQEFSTDSGSSIAVLNARDKIQEEAALNICLTTFIMSIFAIGSFVISVDTFMLVYPLEYLVIVVKRLSSIAAHVNQQSNTAVAHNQLFTSIMQAMTAIFVGGKRAFICFVNCMENAEGINSNLSDDDLNPQMLGNKQVTVRSRNCVQEIED
eukprot:391551_1